MKANIIVQCDDKNNTQETLDEGKIVIDIFIDKNNGVNKFLIKNINIEKVIQ